MSASKDHSRYPYTYSADMIRCVVGPDVSRSEAASLSKHIAVALGVDKEVLCKALADYYIANEESLNNLCFNKTMANMGFTT